MGLLDLLFPKVCVGCGRWGSYVCVDCMQKIKVEQRQKCPMCEKLSLGGLIHARCKTQLGMDGLLSGFRYTGILRRMISSFKYAFVSDMLDDLIEMWVSFVDLESMATKGELLVTGVPLHTSKMRYRGFNQAELLGKKIADYFGWEYREVLSRMQATSQQSGLTRESRLRNMHNAFEVNDKAVVRNKNWLVVDDIWTTGSTMRECAKALKRSGAQKVWGLTLAA